MLVEPHARCQRGPSSALPMRKWLSANRYRPENRGPPISAVMRRTGIVKLSCLTLFRLCSATSKSLISRFGAGGFLPQNG